MLKKLLNYELRATGRILLPVWGGALGLACLTALLGCVADLFPALGDQKWYTFLSVLVLMLTVLGLVAVMFVCVFVNVQRFYQLLGPQGYLMLSLPVSAREHMAAKLINAMLTTAATLFVAFLCTLAMGLSLGDFKPAELSALSFRFSPDAFGLALYALVLFVLLLAGAYLFFYLCVAIGGQWPQQRLLASIITYFAAQLAMQILVILAALLLGFSLWGLFGSDPSGSPALMIAGGLLFALLCAAWDAILWVAIHHFITAKLNLA